MRYTHRDWQRIFRVPFGSWLVPVVGSLLCILIMKGISKEAGFGFLVWTGIGQIIYFSYGFWHSKRRQPVRQRSISSTTSVSTVDDVMMQCMHYKPESDLTKEVTNNQAEDDLIHYF